MSDQQTQFLIDRIITCRDTARVQLFNRDRELSIAFCNDYTFDSLILSLEQLHDQELVNHISSMNPVVRRLILETLDCWENRDVASTLALLADLNIPVYVSKTLPAIGLSRTISDVILPTRDATFAIFRGENADIDDALRARLNIQVVPYFATWQEMADQAARNTSRTAIAHAAPPHRRLS